MVERESEIKFKLIVAVLLCVILSSYILMEIPTNNDEIIQKEFSSISLNVKPVSERSCGCYCEYDGENTDIYVNRAPRFINWGVN